MPWRSSDGCPISLALGPDTTDGSVCSPVSVFEDLDRFDDPKIFEALRELNTLLNNAAKCVKEKKPLRSGFLSVEAQIEISFVSATVHQKS